MATNGKVLFVLTSADKFPKNGKPTGWYLPEAAHPYEVVSPHYEIVWASPAGGAAPLDPGSAEMFKEDPICTKFLNDEVAAKGVKETHKLSDVLAKHEEYKAIFYVGGHGPLFDLATDPTNIKLAEHFYQSGRPIGAICHGPAAIVNVKGKDGKSIFDGRKVTSFSDQEEELVQLVDQVPWLLETRIKELGGKYNKNEQPFQPHGEIDGNVFTAANPASGEIAGKQLLQLLGH